MSEHNYEPLWQEAMNQIKTQYVNEGRETEFTLWFRMEYIEDERNTITVAVASDFLWQRMLSMGNVELVKNKIKELTGIEDIEIRCIIKNTAIVPETKPAALPEEKTAHEITAPVSKQEMPVQENHLAEITGPADNPPAETYTHPELNANYTFETFVPGENSMYAYNAALAAAKEPGQRYNPILLYGGSGLGKTHLMEAVGNYIYNNTRGKAKISYISAESFTNEFTKSITTKTTDKFNDKYRKLDVFLLDDIHFLPGKEATQEALFYTFDALEAKHSQMIFTCDRPITEVKGIAERLRTRFAKGLRIDISIPNYETRCAILQKKIEVLNKSVSQEVIDYIASNIETNVRDLESAILKIIGFSEFTKKEIDLETAKDLLKDMVNPSGNENITIELIQKTVAEYYNISVNDIKGRSRSHKIVFPRQIAIYITREITEYSFPDIGGEFGGKDHTTAMHSYNVIANALKTDSTLESTIKLIIKKIKESKK